MDKFVSQAVVNNYATVRNRLADAGIGVVFTGHFHTSDIAKDYNGDLTKAIYDINTGSLISYPCDYREVTLSADLHTLHITTGHISSLPNDAHFTTTSKERLATSMKQRISDRSDALSLLADDVAEAFIVHAEGNEHLSQKSQELLNKMEYILNGARDMIKMMPQLKEKLNDVEKMANSVMKDISEYGESGRENQTDDLTLTIELP